MYCVNCGVELADSETVCPLCGTRVFHPDLSRPQADAPYPPDHHVKPEDVNRSGILFVMTMLALLPAVICLLCDWRINGGIVWSGFAAGAIGLLYVLIVLPMWFKRPNPVIFVPVDFVAIGLYLLYIDLTAVVALVRYVRGGYLYIFGGALILAGGLAVLIEFLINVTFGIHKALLWSIYPLAAGVILGGMLLVIAICKPLRKSLHRKFFF